MCGLTRETMALLRRIPLLDVSLSGPLNPWPVVEWKGSDNVKAVRIKCGDCGDVVEVPANGDYARCSCPGTWHISTAEVIEAEDDG